MHASFVFIYSWFAYILPKANTKNPLRVIGGGDVVDDQYRYIVAIRHWSKENNEVTNVGTCTGAVISPTWTLTAFHCEREKTDELFSTILLLNPADNNYNDTSKYNVQYFVHPPSAKIIFGSAYVNDIALAKTETIQLAIYGKLCAVDYKTLYGQEVDVFGYGDMNYTQNENEGQMELDTAADLNKPLQTAKAMMYGCHEYRKLSIFERSVVCLGFACDKQSMFCHGDSGGPIIHPRGGIIAIVHGGPPNSICFKNLNADPEAVRPHNTAFGTLVEPNLNWIISKLGEE